MKGVSISPVSLTGLLMRASLFVFLTLLLTSAGLLPVSAKAQSAG